MFTKWRSVTQCSDSQLTEWPTDFPEPKRNAESSIHWFPLFNSAPVHTKKANLCMCEKEGHGLYMFFILILILKGKKKVHLQYIFFQFIQSMPKCCVCHDYVCSKIWVQMTPLATGDLLSLWLSLCQCTYLVNKETVCKEKMFYFSFG